MVSSPILIASFSAIIFISVDIVLMSPGIRRIVCE